MSEVKLANYPDVCNRHKPFAGGTLAWYVWIEKKEKKKAKQKECPNCLRWFFKEEY